MASDPLIAVRETSRMKSLFSWNFLQKLTKRRGIVPLAPTISPTTSMEYNNQVGITLRRRESSSSVVLEPAQSGRFSPSVLQPAASRGQPIRGGPPAWGLGEGLTTHHRKKQLVTNFYNKPRNETDSLARPQQRNKVMRFGTWNVTSLYRTGGVTLLAKELARYRIDFVGVREVRLDGNGISQMGDYFLYYGEGNNNHQLGPGFFVQGRDVDGRVILKWI
ncbi:hypothetical protein ANN_04947 [Periplaneta americana]|uniref:Endonuclease/exonuclease/phosphatase domain-containing protein n=1 Tax=Periplaneta americana TaxID=6978 RepID=A0ABQ8T9T0_PERAM|nr:hypothetical protein ANN_04947 [Periplaneta americana]